MSRQHVFYASPYLLLVFMLLSGFTALNLGTRALTGSRSRPENPFADYVTVFPGQPRSAVPGRGFSCPMSAYSSYPPYAEEICVFWPQSGIFSQITVVVSGDTVRQINFFLQAEHFRIGDLILLWGRPDKETGSHATYLHWPQRGIFAVADDYEGRFSFTLPVHRVVLANPGDGLP